MTKASAGATNPYTKTGVRIVVAGEQGTGKTSLIVTAASERFPKNVPPVLPPTSLPKDIFPDHVPITIIDTSSRVEDDYKVTEELKRADAVVFTYACDVPSSLERLSTFWFPKLCKLEVKIPVIVVGCKLDLSDENQQVSLEQVMSPLMEQFREIETCTRCSALKQIQTREVFYYAQKVVLHPAGPLFDEVAETLSPRFVRALKRIFFLCDHDSDGALNDAELNDFQVKCFNAPLQPSEIVGLKRVISEKLGEGVDERGITWTGFLFLHQLHIDKWHLETIWTILRKFGYNNDFKLAEDVIPSTFKRAPDQTVELTNEATKYLREIFGLNSTNLDGVLGPHEIGIIFSYAPESPWEREPYADAAQKNKFGGLSLDGFLSMWAFMTLVDPAWSMENMLYVGYPGNPLSAFRVTRKRRLDRKKQQTDRNVFQCFVFGPKKAGKSAFLNSFIGRDFSDKYTSTDVEDHYAVNVVDRSTGTKKTLVLREIPEDRVAKLLSDEESLAPCDVAVFVHDGSNRATELLVEVASHGEDTGFEVPCLVVASKEDLDSFSMATHNSNRVCQDMGIVDPIPISTKSGNLDNIFCRIVSAAEHPHMRIPKAKTEAGRSRKQYRLINHSLMVFSVGAAVAIVGLVLRRQGIMLPVKGS